mgnify:CR=1 FL=1
MPRRPITTQPEISEQLVAGIVGQMWDQLETRRRELKLRRASVCRSAGVNYSTWKVWINRTKTCHHRSPNIETLIRIGAVLGMEFKLQVSAQHGAH